MSYPVTEESRNLNNSEFLFKLRAHYDQNNCFGPNRSYVDKALSSLLKHDYQFPTTHDFLQGYSHGIIWRIEYREKLEAKVQEKVRKYEALDKKNCVRGCGRITVAVSLLFAIIIPYFQFKK